MNINSQNCLICRIIDEWQDIRPFNYSAQQTTTGICGTQVQNCRQNHPHLQACFELQEGDKLHFKQKVFQNVALWKPTCKNTKKPNETIRGEIYQDSYSQCFKCSVRKRLVSNACALFLQAIHSALLQVFERSNWTYRWNGGWSLENIHSNIVLIWNRVAIHVLDTNVSDSLNSSDLEPGFSPSLIGILERLKEYEQAHSRPTQNHWNLITIRMSPEKQKIEILLAFAG